MSVYLHNVYGIILQQCQQGEFAVNNCLIIMYVIQFGKLATLVAVSLSIKISVFQQSQIVLVEIERLLADVGELLQ